MTSIRRYFTAVGEFFYQKEWLYGSKTVLFPRCQNISGSKRGSFWRSGGGGALPLLPVPRSATDWGGRVFILFLFLNFLRYLELTGGIFRVGEI
jgi:hypothetical protein